MKRKTNLFYTSGPDSKFLTFSNYTEALTGNFLSVNTKLFPDRFLCLKIHGLNSASKENFIKYLVAYYENKLAVLRDNSVSKNDTVEHNIYPLGYLLEAILKVCSYDEDINGFRIMNNLVINLLKQLQTEDPKIVANEGNNKIRDLIAYIGDITEFDYNGTYTDIICSINMTSYNEGVIKLDNSVNNIVNTCTIDSTKTKSLHGWETEPTLFESYTEVLPIFDSGKNTYSYNTKISRIEVKNIDLISKDTKDLKFNVIIPLFSYCNTDMVTNTNILDKKFDIDEQTYYYDVNNANNSVFDVPLGIWIHADSIEDTFIELQKDTNLNTYPSWSLLISSQFKPFPYSLELQKQNSTSESILHGFSTFSEILTKMSNALDSFNEMNQNIVSLSNRISAVESKLKEINTDTNISKINKDILTLKTELKENVEDLKQRIVNVRWSHA